MTESRERPSHIGPEGRPIPLSTHLDDVAERTAMLVAEDAETPAGNSLRELTRTVALVHDFGKLTTWFHEHLLSGGNAVPDGPTHHAPLGSLVTHYVLSKRGFDGADPLVGFLAVAKHHGRLPDTAPYVQNVAVEQSGRLQSLYREEVLDQIEHLDGTASDLADTLIQRASGGTGSWEAFRELSLQAETTKEFPWLADHACSGRRLRPASEKLPDGFYAATLQAWSALVLADKTSAASLTTGIDIGASAYRSEPPKRSAIDEHVERIRAENAEAAVDERTKRMNELREEARRSIRNRAERFADSDRRVATLTLPTGMGKTLSGMGAALTVLDGEVDGRLVYALPFTSIIDQVAAESREIFDANPNEPGDLLTVDHHLSDTLVSPSGLAEEVLDDSHEDIAAMLGESWRSGVVITTFVQLFESLAGPTNARSMKLPSLYDSVVVLDEPQALPLAWWPLVNRLVELLTGTYDASIIAMTATQPKLLSEGDREPFALVEDSDPYFGALDRLDFELHPSAESMLPGEGDPNPLAYDRAAGLLAEHLATGSSVLSICNTIDSARELADALLEHSNPVNVNQVYHERLACLEGNTDSGGDGRTNESEPGDVNDELNGWSTDLTAEGTVAASLAKRIGEEPLLVHLTTRHRPCDRRHLIDVATALTQAGEPVAFVSTQLVEAGVDVSFDEVVRDFAPMDSLVQAAGRCNRSFDRDRGHVTIWLLAPPEGRTEPPARAVYGLGGESLTMVTAGALSAVYNGEPMAEPVVTRDAVERYFEALDARGVGSTEYVEYLERAEAAKLGDLSIIDQQHAADVVVARTKEESALLDRIRKAHRERRWGDLDDLVDFTRELQVSIPLYPGDEETAEKLVHLDSLIPGGERLQLDGRPARDGGYFDPTDGVVVPDTSVEARLL